MRNERKSGPGVRAATRRSLAEGLVGLDAWADPSQDPKILLQHHMRSTAHERHQETVLPVNPFTSTHPAAPLAIAALVASTAFAGRADATLRHVPSSYATVALAVAEAASGDTVLIAPGTHLGGAWIDGKSLTIGSTYVLTGDTTVVTQTVLDGVGTKICGNDRACVGNAVLEFGDNAHGSAVIGLTLINGENGISS